MEEFTATADDEGMRLDQFLARAAGPELSRSRIKALIDDGHVMLNGVVASHGKQKVQPGDKASFERPPPAEADPVPEKIALNVLYEDADLIVIDKPAGMVVHPGAGNPSGTLVNALLAHCGDTLSGIGGVKRPGIVHRLDKDTSGVMVVAKNDAAHKNLSAQFADHGRTGDLKRTYAALVWGVPDRNKGTIETHLGRSSRDRTKQAVVGETQPDARHAVTHFKVCNRFGDAGDPIASLVSCTLETGRTHQIRVHMAHIGHPLIGDHVYGAGFASKANKLHESAQSAITCLGRQALHAQSLAFTHPTTDQLMAFESPLPTDMERLSASLPATSAVP